MADNPHLMDENNIPDSLTPIEVPAAVPGRAPLGAPAPPIPHDMPQFFSGSMPPSLQHDVSFVGTEVGTPRIDKYSLMPFGNQANPFTNAAAASTASGGVTPPTPAPTPEDVESIAVNLQTGTDYDIQLSDRNTLVSMSNNSGGRIRLPGPVTGAFAFVQVVAASGGASAVVNITNTAGNLMIMSVKISDGGFTSPTVVDTLGNTWTLIAVSIDAGNIPTSFFYAFNIAGGVNAITVTNPSTSTFCLPTVLEYSGFGTSDPLVNFVIGSGNVPTITTIEPDCLIYSGIRFGTAAAPVSAAGWTQRYVDGVQELDQDQIASTSGSIIASTSTPTTFGASAVNFIGAFQTSSGPDSALFPKGWFTYIENTGTGSFTVSSSAMIDGSSSGLTLQENQGILVVWDGFNWYTERGMGTANLFYQTVQSAGVDKPQEAKLNFLSAFTVTDNPGNNSTDIDISSFASAVVKINGVGVSLDKQFFINGVSDGASVWGVDINGTPDGG